MASYVSCQKKTPSEVQYSSGLFKLNFSFVSVYRRRHINTF